MTFLVPVAVLRNPTWTPGWREGFFPDAVRGRERPRISLANHPPMAMCGCFTSQQCSLCRTVIFGHLQMAGGGHGVVCLFLWPGCTLAGAAQATPLSEIVDQRPTGDWPMWSFSLDTVLRNHHCLITYNGKGSGEEKRRIWETIWKVTEH